jgi:uncharacterized Ntn-hydrolase superfamily protein
MNAPATISTNSSSHLVRGAVIALLLAFAGDARATYSIVARDPATGELGVAVQSHWFSVGSGVAWAESEVGAVATQSFVDPSYGPLGLELMRAGRTAPDALKALTAVDPQLEVRQIAMIDARGNVVAHTGKNAIADAGHITGTNYSVQANLMASAEVWPAMARAFESAKGDLAERMLAALEAAQKAGGDIRGKQSAALIVVRGKSTGKKWADRVFDLRIDDHPDPINELRRLVRLQRAYNFMNRGDELAAEAKWDQAMQQYLEGAKLAPEIEELPYWVAVTLFTAGREEEALPMFRDVFRRSPSYIELTRRLPKAGLLPDDPKKIDRILSVAPKP